MAAKKNKELEAAKKALLKSTKAFGKLAVKIELADAASEKFSTAFESMKEAHETLGTDIEAMETQLEAVKEAAEAAD